MGPLMMDRFFHLPVLFLIALTTASSWAADKATVDPNDPFAKAGNAPVKAAKLSPEKEAEILKDVKVADGFDVTIFAAPPMVNYPVFVAAAPDGTLYVSSDGNGSLGRDPGRGRVIRLRDTDGDGRADETKVFCEVDAPRGLVWDHDRLYLVHPPHLSEFIDADGDGVAEKQNVLVKNIAFGYKDRPADHTTNGLSLGIDGWLYIAGGDFGFMDAEGTDGRHLQHRGGGVIRVRPDGTGLELYCTGTRNILEVAISPTMDLFARDNTNDGGGWNVRFHHLIPGGDHGYPRLFKNFPDEIIPPLADYGGGSGCGAVFIDEPGFGEWNNAPFTCDWGTGALWHHQVKPKGATFEETRDPVPFVKMTRPTDADVDAMSHLYVASWKGATFKWEGPDVGYIVRVTPHSSSGLQPETAVVKTGGDGESSGGADGLKPSTTFAPAPLPDFAKASEKELVKLLESPSHRRRMEAQRELGRRIVRTKERIVATVMWIREAETLDDKSKRKPMWDERIPKYREVAEPLTSMAPKLADVISRQTCPQVSKIAALYLYPGGPTTSMQWTTNPVLLRHILRTARIPFVGEGNEGPRREPLMWNFIPHERTLGPVIECGLKSADPGTRIAALACVPMYAGWRHTDLASTLLGDLDPVVRHIATRTLGRFPEAIENIDARDRALSGAGPPLLKAFWLELLSSESTSVQTKRSILMAWGMSHDLSVTLLIDELASMKDRSIRRGILAALCRLHFHEGEWKGDSWGTRPDTRGPYYQPEPWSETERIAVALKEALDAAEPGEAAFLIQEMRRNRIQSDDALNRVLALAEQDPKVVPDAVAQLAAADEVPAEAVGLLIGTLKWDAPVSVLSNAIVALAKTDSADGCAATLSALPKIEAEVTRLEAVVKEVAKMEDPHKAKHEGKNARTRVEEAKSTLDAAVTAFLKSPKLENHHLFLERKAEKVGTPEGRWADAALLTLSARKSGSPESREMTAKALDAGWESGPERRIQILEAAMAIKHRALADKVLAAAADPDAQVQKVAKSAAKKLGIKTVEDSTPKVSTLSPEDAIAAVLKTKGDLATGEQMFTKATCIACHTVSESEAQKGPYLGNIAQTYKRPELAQNILDPNKTIAQGFASELITLNDGTQQMGFITLEGATEVKLRNIAAQEFTFKTTDIKERQKLPTSMMPPGLMMNSTVYEFASLLDYLEDLSKAK